VILTFSGKVEVSSGSELWSRIARVMKAAGANIETAGGTFVQMARGGNSSSNEDSPDSVSFSVSAFGAQISPAVLKEGREDLGCAMYVKALLPQSRVPKMMQLLRAESPLQVYTVSNSAKVSAKLAKSHGYEDARTGTVHLFGVDAPGQLARITETLRNFGATVMLLRVKSNLIGVVPPGVPPLCENRVRIVFDESLDEGLLRRELQRVGQEVGYAVTCLTTDTQSRLRATLPSYVLRKKAFAMAYLSTVTGQRERRRRSATAMGSLPVSKAVRAARRALHALGLQDLHRRRRRRRPQVGGLPRRRCRADLSQQCWHI